MQNPFNVEVEEPPAQIQKSLNYKNHNNYKDTFETGINFEKFWCKRAISYNKFPDNALRSCCVFSNFFIWRGIFLSVSDQKQSEGSVRATDGMRVVLSSSVIPRISSLVNKVLAQKSFFFFK
jgi:hypothetical protein